PCLIYSVIYRSFTGYPIGFTVTGHLWSRNVSAFPKPIALLICVLRACKGTMADGRFDWLRLYLHKLPSSLPYQDINGAERDFTCFAVDEEDDFVKEEGVDAAVNRQLEHMLGLRIGPSGTFTLKECGPGIEALADVLENFCERFPEDVRLTKWVDDATRAAENAFKLAKVPVRI
ncbi:hypothetical protein C8Q72DRAFT_903984, partial [Fomitopsis betulina]